MTKTSELINKINLFENYISNYEKERSEISQASVGWHIEHSLMTIEKISKAVIKSDPTKYKWSFNLTRYLILVLKRMPRGKVKAPSVVYPIAQATTETLMDKIGQTRELMENLNTLESNKFFTHPYLGDLKLKQAILCMDIHTQHHLNIIRDIVKAK